MARKTGGRKAKATLDVELAKGEPPELQLLRRFSGNRKLKPHLRIRAAEKALPFIASKQGTSPKKEEPVSPSDVSMFEVARRYAYVLAVAAKETSSPPRQEPMLALPPPEPDPVYVEIDRRPKPPAPMDNAPELTDSTHEYRQVGDFTVLVEKGRSVNAAEQGLVRPRPQVITGRG